jgi:competence protein ComEC
MILLGCLLLLVGAAVPLVRQCTAPQPAASPWVFAVCDVGQGDALFLSVGPHAAVAVDTGPDPDREDACAERLGITEVPLVVLTHFHADHIDGLAGLLRRGRQVREIETTTAADPPAGAAQVARLAAAARIPVRPVTPDERRSVGPVAWRVLWPQAEHPLTAPPAADSGGMDGGGGMGGAGGKGEAGGMGGAGASGSGMGGAGGMAEDGPNENPGPNNDSIVMAVTIAAPGTSAASTAPDTSGTSAESTAPGTPAASVAPSVPGAPDSPTPPGAPAPPLKILLTGDIETPVQQTLLADRREYLRADVLKVPHHGSAKQDPDFLAAVQPSVSVISVGAGNPYGHPAPRTVYLAGADGARVYRTDLDGMVLIGIPTAPDGPIPVTADHGDGTVPTGPPPSPIHSARSRHGGGGSHRHRPTHESEALHLHLAPFTGVPRASRTTTTARSPPAIRRPSARAFPGGCGRRVGHGT